ncbi:MAG: C13 family peptidase [Syntrophobacteraceae bacterium]
MKEIKYIRDLFDKRFNTKGRSIALINNVDTMSSLPLASKNNLNHVIQHIGKVMNPEEDILFLYLTSHGSKEKGLSVEFTPLQLNMIDPKSLKAILNNSGIKYRVLVISACYSGIFTEPLKDEYTLIMTASAPDKQSFGCSNEGDFTYLGKALFEEQLSHSFSLLDAFGKAIESINKREKIEGLEPSQPQLFVGEEIGKKLELLSQKLAVIESEHGLEPGRD